MTIRAVWKLCRALAVTICLSGCVLSDAPVIPELSATFEPLLVGTWEEVSGSDIAVVTRSEKNSYAIEYTSNGKKGRFDARFGRLGDRLVLDVWPAPREGELPQPYSGALVAAHLLVTLDIGQNDISAAIIEPDSLHAALRSGQFKLPYTHSKDQLILHGTTEELRGALGPYLAGTTALTKPAAWRRVADDATTILSPVEVPCFEASAWREKKPRQPQLVPPVFEIRYSRLIHFDTK
jgi:hypothetical protein